MVLKFSARATPCSLLISDFIVDGGGASLLIADKTNGAKKETPLPPLTFFPFHTLPVNFHPSYPSQNGLDRV